MERDLRRCWVHRIDGHRIGIDPAGWYPDTQVVCYEDSAGIRCSANHIGRDHGCQRFVKTPGARCYQHEEPLVRVVKRAMRMK